jgi:hypothetical protein
VALNAISGEILWKRYVVPDNDGAAGGYSGGAVWQPPAIDPARGLLYVGTGNNYISSRAAGFRTCSGTVRATALAGHHMVRFPIPLESLFLKWLRQMAMAAICRLWA